MSLTSQPNRPRLKFHPQAYVFISDALKVAQSRLGKSSSPPPDDDSDAADDTNHISGRELLEGVRILGEKAFGMLAPTVFRTWGIASTHDFGRLVFELIERGEMRKTDRDQLSDFSDVYDFDSVFDSHYVIDVSKAFRSGDRPVGSPGGSKPKPESGSAG